MDTDVGAEIAAPPLSRVWLIAKVVDDSVTLTVAAAVDPTAVAVTVATPTPPATPATLTVNFPALSVTPDAGVTVTTPVPEATTEIGALATPVPCAFRAMKTILAGDVPLSGTVWPLPLNTASVEPEIWIGIWAVANSEVAVIVAVRLARLPTPDENVKVAVPFAPVVTVAELTTPVSVPSAMGTPGRAAFDAFNAVTVTVVLAVLSEGTDVGEADRVRSTAAPLLGGVPVAAEPAGSGLAGFPQLPRLRIDAMATIARIALLTKPRGKTGA
ncbi:MAG: hypothetical protein OEW21_02415 [Betaproteobacteria bacterium]|nr:hypothetical protein [Betaproteobacteria bacterium]